MTKPAISAIVIAYNGIDFIADCLRTLKADLAGWEHEIIVIDNDSRDGTVAFIETNYPDIKLTKNDCNRGFARAINQGIAAARYEYLWLLNQDIRIRPGCLEALVACSDHLSNPGIIGPKLVGFDGRVQKFCRRFPNYQYLSFELTGLARLFPRSGLFNGWKMGEFDHLTSRAVDQPMGAAMFLRRACLDDIGVMDESFGIFFNDVDLCHRLADRGYANFYCTEGIIEHFAGGSVSRQKPGMVWRSHLSMFRYLKKWEKDRPQSVIIACFRRPLVYAAGVALLLAAVPRSLYHLIKKII